MGWIEVIDSAVKIGFGALISAFASYLILRRNQKHEIDKESRELINRKTEERKLNYSKFLTHSAMLAQKYRDENCNAQEEDYIEFLDIYHRIQITSCDKIRVGTYNLFNAVNEFIVIRKNEQDRELLRSMRKNIDLRTAEFQFLAREDLVGNA
ncbi:TPA: hypothetical protein ACTW1J_001394 [Raoultella planticola]|jgi:hypothetical protein|uniref:hypothetical protein n=1 Tax=Klebsiella aerogenes TaxID=548 RepID=UPI0019058174|nr:hypothetical protein [Klebsiella aerogenes]MBK0624142.1 hypothetical protein [Klebsiella aerogenes]HAU5003282.1 hypothetical protein [Raoultella ornithinolytica]